MKFRIKDDDGKEFEVEELEETKDSEEEFEKKEKEEVKDDALTAEEIASLNLACVSCCSLTKSGSLMYLLINVIIQLSTGESRND